MCRHMKIVYFFLSTPSLHTLIPSTFPFSLVLSQSNVERMHSGTTSLPRISGTHPALILRWKKQAYKRSMLRGSLFYVYPVLFSSKASFYLMACFLSYCSKDTIFLCECVLVYMEPSRVVDILSWAAHSFASAAFIDYEPVYHLHTFINTPIQYTHR